MAKYKIQLNDKSYYIYADSQEHAVKKLRDAQAKRISDDIQSKIDAITDIVGKVMYGAFPRDHGGTFSYRIYPNEVGRTIALIKRAFPGIEIKKWSSNEIEIFKRSLKDSCVSDDNSSEFREELDKWQDLYMNKKLITADELQKKYYELKKKYNITDSEEQLNNIEENTEITDMALSRSDAMDRCISLGKRFIEHFDKVYKEPKSQARSHWTGEMQGWLNSVRQIKLKTTNDAILDGDLRDWFFTAGANPQDFMTSPTSEELKAYDKFTTSVINGNSVVNALNSVGIKDELIQSGSEEAFKKNIATEIKAGKDPKQAAAIAYNIQRENDNKVADTDLVEGKTYTSNKGNKIKVKKVVSGYSDYDGEPYVNIYYDFETIDGKRGSSKCNTNDFFKMLKDSSINDSVSKIENIGKFTLWQDNDTKEYYFDATVSRSGKTLYRLNTTDINKAREKVKKELEWISVSSVKDSGITPNDVKVGAVFYRPYNKSNKLGVYRAVEVATIRELYAGYVQVSTKYYVIDEKAFSEGKTNVYKFDDKSAYSRKIDISPEYERDYEFAVSSPNSKYVKRVSEHEKYRMEKIKQNLANELNKENFIKNKPNVVLKDSSIKNKSIADAKLVIPMRTARENLPDIDEDLHWYNTRYGSLNFNTNDSYLTIEGSQSDLDKFVKQYHLNDSINDMAASKSLYDSAIRDSFIKKTARNVQELKSIIRAWNGENLIVSIMAKGNLGWIDVYYYKTKDGYYRVPIGTVHSTTEYDFTSAKQSALRYADKFFEDKRFFDSYVKTVYKDTKSKLYIEYDLDSKVYYIASDDDKDTQVFKSLEEAKRYLERNRDNLTRILLQDWSISDEEPKNWVYVMYGSNNKEYKVENLTRVEAEHLLKNNRLLGFDGKIFENIRNNDMNNTNKMLDSDIVVARSIDDLISKIKSWNGETTTNYIYSPKSSGWYFDYFITMGYKYSYYAYIKKTAHGRHDNPNVDISRQNIDKTVTAKTAQELIDQVVRILK